MSVASAGPRVGAPDGAIAGFLKSAKLSSINQAQVRKDEKKGEFYVAVIAQARRSEDLADFMEALEGLLAFLPCGSSTNPRQITFRYAFWPNRIVDSASSE